MTTRISKIMEGLDLPDRIEQPKASQTTSLQKRSDAAPPARLKRTPEGTEISLYEGGMLTERTLAIYLKKLREAFPRQTDTFFDILTERIIANGFSDQRLADAVNNVIDNFRYKELSVADIIQHDKRVKLYTYSEVAAMVTAGKAAFDDFEIREINGKTYRVKKSDITP